MEYIKTEFEGLYIINPKVFKDERGYFFESYSKTKEKNAHLEYSWVQDNEAYSEYGVLRGLHYQTGESCQSKLVRVIHGTVQDVVVDIRPNSKTYGKHLSIILSGENKTQLLVPKGFAHGYVVISPTAIFSYKCDNFYDKLSEGGIHYNDSALGINWDIPPKSIKVSEKDEILPRFGQHKDL